MILLTIPGLVLGSYSLFLVYLWYFPNYQINQKNNDILDYFDLETLVFLHRWRKTGFKANQIIRSLDSSDVAVEMWYRLEMFKVGNDSFDEQTLNSILQKSVDKPDLYTLLLNLIGLAPFNEILVASKISSVELDELGNYYRQKSQRLREQSLYWLDPKNHHQGGFADDWTVSYTNLLDSLSFEVTGSIHRRVSRYPLYNREILMTQVIDSLEKSRGQNVMLVGPEGSGRDELFYHVASKLLNYEVDSNLAGIGIRVLEPQQIVQYSNDANELIQIVNKLFREIGRAKRVVVYIPELDSLLDPSNQVGKIDISEPLSSHLSNEDVHIVASISQESYVSLIKTHPTLSQSFSVVNIPPPTTLDVAKIVLAHVGQVEAKSKIIFLYSAILELVNQAPKYLKDFASPQRELLLLEDIAAYVTNLKETTVERQDVVDTISQKTGVPIGFKGEEKSIILDLETNLNQKVIGQKDATKTISQAILRARAGLKETDKPIASFLFLGPTGVGKTETAKALAELYFGSAKQLIHLDMTEYGSANGLERLLGSNEIDDPGSLTIKIQERPSAIVLFDEIEKAHIYVKNSLLQVLDEGRLTTNFGKVLDFTNSIVIATSNAGSEFIRTQIGAGKQTKEIEKQLLDFIFSQGIFSPELVNRFDGVVIYSPLSVESVQAIVKIRVQELAMRLKDEKGIMITFSNEVINSLTQLGYDPVFGARALERAIKNQLETSIARLIIEKNPEPGTTITLESI